MEFDVRGQYADLESHSNSETRSNLLPNWHGACYETAHCLDGVTWLLWCCSGEDFPQRTR
jgi:hypothetical protein